MTFYSQEKYNILAKCNSNSFCSAEKKCGKSQLIIIIILLVKMTTATDKRHMYYVCH